jgi:hypothetical protein
MVSTKELPSQVHRVGQLAAVALLCVALLILGLGLPGKASAEATAVEAVPSAAATASDGVEAVAATASSASPVETTGEAAEAALPSAPSVDTTAPPPPPPSPSSQAQETLEHTAATVTAAVDSATSSQPAQGVVSAAQEGVAEVSDRATETGGAVLDDTAKTVQRTTSRTLDQVRPVRGVLPSSPDSTGDTLSRIGQIDPSSPEPPTGNPPSIEDGPLISPAPTEAGKPPHRPLAPGASFFSSPPFAPVISALTPSTIPGDDGRSLFTGASVAPPRLNSALGESSSGAPLPTVPPVPSLPVVFDAVTSAPGGAGSVLFLALLALSLLLAPVFASKLRMHAGNCRPAPFVSLLERPG